MPIKDPEARKAYQRKWAAKRRSDWLTGKVCQVCGSAENLEVDHKDSTMKLDHRVWTWGKNRRDAELLKCQVLCREHHLHKTAENVEGQYDYAKEAVDEAVRLRETGLSFREVEKLTGISKSQVHRVAHGEQRKDR